jgi:hypothetical protein
MPKWLRSKIGLVLAVIYLIIFVLLTLMVYVGPSDGLAALIPLGLTMPWSFALLDAIPENVARYFGTLGVFLLVALCALLNATILYAFGLLITTVLRLVAKTQSNP